MSNGIYQIQHLVNHQVRNTYEVPSDRLFQELETLGVPTRLHTYEQSTAACGYYGEYVKWESTGGTEMAEYEAPEKIAEGTQDGPGARQPKTWDTPKLCGCTCGEPVSAKATFRQGHDQKLIGKLAAAAVDPEAYLTNELVQRLQLPTEAEDPKLDIQIRIDHVSDAMTKYFSAALTAKYVYAAGAAWDKAVRNKKTAPVTPEDTAQPNAALVASKIKNERAKAREDMVGVDKAVAIAEELSTQPSKPLAEVEAEYNDEMRQGAAVRIKVGRKRYDATVHGMSQAGKVTAVRYYTSGGNEMVKTEGQFELIEQIPG